MSSLHDVISVWGLPPDTVQKFGTWLTHPETGFNLADPPDEAFYSIDEKDLVQAGFTLRQRRSVLAKLKPAAGAAALQAEPIDECTALAELLSGLDHVPTPEEAKSMLLSSEPRRKVPVLTCGAHKAMVPKILEVVEQPLSPTLFSFLICWPVEDGSESKTMGDHGDICSRSL
ncbi:g2177 [Coccomyxa elongata]